MCADTSNWCSLGQVEENTASGAAALQLAAFLFYSHSFERACSLLQRQVEAAYPAADHDVLRAQALLGFVLLEQQAQEEPELQDSSELHHALQLFDSVLKHEPQDLEVRVLLLTYMAADQVVLLARSTYAARPSGPWSLAQLCPCW